MPDIRTLLEDTTARAPHPDPVAAVRATVRRRARRRQVATGVTAAGAVAVAAGVGVATLPDRRSVTTPAGTPHDWRPVDATRLGPEARRLAELASARPDVFLFVSLDGGTPRPSNAFVVGLAGDADPAEWADDVAAAAGAASARLHACPSPASHYDRLAREAAAARWPSGAAPERRAVAETRTGGCQVLVVMPYEVRHDGDAEFARDRWNGDVGVMQRPLPSGGETPLPRPGTDADVEVPELAAVSALVERNPAAFVGIVGDRSITVALGPGADVAVWEPRVRAAAGRYLWRLKRCAYSRSELASVQSALASFAWPSGRRPAFGTHVSAATCRVEVTGTFAAEDAAALQEAFEDKILVRTGAAARD